MKYKIILKSEKVFASDISKIGKKELDNIFLKLEKLKVDGVKNCHVKKLNNYSISDFRLRVGNYRILFNFYLERKEVVIIRILHRGKLY